MRPPECAICGREFGAAEGALVTFAPRASDIEWRERSQREGFVGHPPNVEWFCGEHAAAAQARVGETIDIALAGLRADAPAGAAPALEFATVPIRPIAPDALAEALRTTLAALATVRPTNATTRDWTPMDNALPPNCPYVDRETVRAGELVLQLEQAFWNDADRARTSAVLLGDTWTLGGHGEGGDVTELLTSGLVPPAAQELVARLSR